MIEREWSPVVIVSIHRDEPPSAIKGDYFFMHENENVFDGADTDPENQQLPDDQLDLP